MLFITDNGEYMGNEIIKVNLGEHNLELLLPKLLIESLIDCIKTEQLNISYKQCNELFITAFTSLIPEEIRPATTRQVDTIKYMESKYNIVAPAKALKYACHASAFLTEHMDKKNDLYYKKYSRYRQKQSTVAEIMDLRAEAIKNDLSNEVKRAKGKENISNLKQLLEAHKDK